MRSAARSISSSGSGAFSGCARTGRPVARGDPNAGEHGDQAGNEIEGALLVAAGFAPIWRETDLAAPALADISSALTYMQAQQEPYPAVVVDRRWNLLRANAGAVRLVEFLVGPLPADAKVNLADALVAPDVLRPFLTNWKDVVRYFIRSVEADAAADGTEESAALLARLTAYDGVRDAVTAPLDDPSTPVLPMHFENAGTTIRLFTTIATLGTPQDITLQELRIESFFPADAGTAKVLRGWAGAPDPTT